MAGPDCGEVEINETRLDWKLFVSRRVAVETFGSRKRPGSNSDRQGEQKLDSLQTNCPFDRIIKIYGGSKVIGFLGRL